MEYVCIGVKASNYFMPQEVLSEKGPGGGGWILMDLTLAVKTRDEKPWTADDKGYPRVFAIGDCNYGCIEEKGKGPNDWPIPPIPKISYPGEEESCFHRLSEVAPVLDGRSAADRHCSRPPRL